MARPTSSPVPTQLLTMLSLCQNPRQELPHYFVPAAPAYARAHARTRHARTNACGRTPTHSRAPISHLQEAHCGLELLELLHL